MDRQLVEQLVRNYWTRLSDNPLLRPCFESFDLVEGNYPVGDESEPEDGHIPAKRVAFVVSGRLPTILGWWYRESGDTVVVTMMVEGRPKTFKTFYINKGKIFQRRRNF